MKFFKKEFHLRNANILENHHFSMANKIMPVETNPMAPEATAPLKVDAGDRSIWPFPSCELYHTLVTTGKELH